jgi:hypothetical protein
VTAATSPSPCIRRPMRAGTVSRSACRQKGKRGRGPRSDVLRQLVRARARGRGARPSRAYRGPRARSGHRSCGYGRERARKGTSFTRRGAALARRDASLVGIRAPPHAGGASVTRRRAPFVGIRAPPLVGGASVTRRRAPPHAGGASRPLRHARIAAKGASPRGMETRWSALDGRNGWGRASIARGDVLPHAGGARMPTKDARMPVKRAPPRDVRARNTRTRPPLRVPGRTSKKDRVPFRELRARIEEIFAAWFPKTRSARQSFVRDADAGNAQWGAGRSIRSAALGEEKQQSWDRETQERDRPSPSRSS